MVNIYTDNDTTGVETQPDTVQDPDDEIRMTGDLGDVGDRWSGHFGFDISSIVGTITSVIFHYRISYIRDVGTFRVFRSTSDFDESTLTWNNQPSYTTTNSVDGSYTGTGWGSIDITNIVNDETSSRLNLQVYSLLHNQGFRVYSKEYSGGTYAPYIAVTYTPFDDYYVRASGGSDGNSGVSWDNAWATVHRGMVTIASDKTLHIGFDENSHADWYDSEPADNKLSPDAADVTVIYETPDTGGGTGYAKVEVNT